MEYRGSLGDSGLKVSCLGLGGNIFGHFCDQKETSDIMGAAREAGINFVDTADVYSEGLSEEYIGESIMGCRDQWIVATKVGVGSWDRPRHSGRIENILSRVEGSLRRLGTDYIDLYQMHHFDPETPLDETLEALNLLVDQGKVRHIGASNYSGDQLRQSLGLARERGFTPYRSTQEPYNLFRRDVESDVFPVSSKSGVGTIVHSALARGVLTGKYRLGQRVPAAARASTSESIRGDLTDAVLETVEGLVALAESRGKTVTHLALAWVLRRPEVMTSLVGVRNVSHLQGSLGAVDWKLTQGELDEIDKIMGDDDRYENESLGARPAWA